MRVRRVAILLLCVSVAFIGLYMLSSHFTASKVIIEADDNSSHSVGVRLIPIALPHEYDGYGFYDAAALSNADVWAVGYNGHDPKRICHYSVNNGNWEVVAIPSSGFTLRAISFPDDQNGWAVGGFGTVIHTSDGGKSWQQLKRPTKADLVSVTFVNDKVGYIGGSKALFDRANERYTYGVVILRTTDGGRSWRTCYEDDYSKYAGRIYALSEMHALILVDRALITEDGGNTWQPVETAGTLGSIAFNREGIGYAASLNGHFQRSVDKGKTWQKITDLPESLQGRQWWSMDFADGIRGLAVGKNGAIALTNDGGRTWSEVHTGIQEDLRKVKLNKQSGLVLGSRSVYQVSVGF